MPPARMAATACRRSSGVMSSGSLISAMCAQTPGNGREGHETGARTGVSLRRRRCNEPPFLYYTESRQGAGCGTGKRLVPVSRRSRNCNHGRWLRNREKTCWRLLHGSEFLILYACSLIRASVSTGVVGE
jgi:hypothetical protein